ncbi:MAG: DUF1501 domain-containing protein [Verrucomicrobium sp.]
MNSSNHACANFASTRLLSRRSLLRVGGMGLFGMTLPKLIFAEEAARNPKLIAKAKSVIFLFQWGGPSHLETFDMKPDAPSGIRGFHKPMASNVDGIRVNSLLPKTSKVMDKVTLIRSVHHTMKNHNSAGYYALTGHAPPSDDQRLKDTPDLFPAYTSVVDKMMPPAGEVPTSVHLPYVISDGTQTPGQFASFLGKPRDPFLVTQDPNGPKFALPELSLPEGITYDRLRSRREMQKLVDSQSRLIEYSAAAKGLDGYYEKALGMLESTQLREAFDLTKEPDKVRDAYGRTPYGQSCLLARRLVEAGVKFVTVTFADSIGGRSTTDGGWDTHGFDDTRMFPIIEQRHLPITEQTLPTLLTDLDERGLLDETLVVWVGEFGRTPKVNKALSRDHWPFCYTALMAGGGTKRGFVYGASYKSGEHPADKPVTPDDLAATMYSLMGIDPDTEVRDAANRPVPLSYGNAIEGVVA